MRTHLLAVIAVAAVGCADASSGGDDGGGDDTSCGDQCDADADGVLDATDACDDTPTGEVVNGVGCADSQVTPTLEPMFPPFGLTWTPTGDPGRAGGLVWAYDGIQRADLFHIYWILCDEPVRPCGISLNGPIDAPSESWRFEGTESDLPGGRIVFHNTTAILLDGGSMVALDGRLTVTIVDGASAPIPFATVMSLGVPARAGGFGAEIPGVAYTVTVLGEVKDATSAWTPYLDYYDAAPTPKTGGVTTVSFGASFYSE
jgi:hypothetical protein